MQPSRRTLAAVLTCLILLGEPLGAATSFVVVHAPRHLLTNGASTAVSNLGWTSTNWSGYAVTAGPYTSVTGAWTVPAVSATTRSTYSSSWIGIDGFTNSNLIQTGTEQDYTFGAARYSAWWEILPAAETVITSLTIHAGDVMQASIAKNQGAGTWTITLADVTSGRTFTTTQAYTGTGASAEWVQEAPTVGGRVATLAHFALTAFDPGTANGGNPGLVASEGGAMVQGGVQVATPSVPDSDLNGFAVQYGAVAPAPPGGGGGGPTTGTITGTVTDSVTTGPIAGATVTYGGGSATTTAGGTYTLSGVMPGTYSVTASASGHSTRTITGVTVTPGAATTVDVALVPVAAAAPGAASLSASGLGLFRHGIRLTWTAAATNGSTITGYQVWRAAASGSETLLTTVGNVLTYTDTTNTAVRTTYYKVVAVNAVGPGPFSNEASAFSF